MPRRRALRILLVGAAAVVVLVLVAAVGVTATVRRPLPAHAGALDLPGLAAEVTVLRDARGVPQLYAESPTDLFAAQGFVHAQDRFFEMDYRRHVTAGRLSELVGEDDAALEADVVIRTLGWRDVAEREWDLLAEDTREYLQAYADGVNAYLDQRGTDALGVEYTVLGLRLDVAEPEPWTPVDSLAWLKAIAWDLRNNYTDELSRAVSYSTVRDVARVDELFPRYPQDVNLPIVTEVQPAAAVVSETPDRLLLDPELQAAVDAAQRALDAVPRLLGEGDGTGSNSWVVSGEHTASGEPLLANDPHLGLSAPGIWSQMGLHCQEVDEACPFDVAGFTFAGLPGVMIGHNADLAWGLTTLPADVTDFFLERVDAADGTYLRDGEQVPLEVRAETIEVAGGEPVEIEVRSTVHGPLVSDALGLWRLGSTPTADGNRPGTEVALSWTALEPGTTADAVFAMAVAKDADDVAAAAAQFTVPSQNIVWASVDGHIGYQAPGRIPVRARVTDGPVPSDGSWPRPGWDSRYDWQGYVDPEDMPAVVDPAEGFVVAANQAVTAAGSGPYLASDWDYGYRSQRIREQLEVALTTATPIDVQHANELQNDEWSPYAEVLLPVLLDTTVDDFTDEAVDLLRDWDGMQAADSAAAAYFAAVWAKLLELTFHDDLPETEWPSGNSRWLAVVTGLLEDADNPWWDDRRTVNVVESRDELLARSLTEARLELTVELGKTADDWDWGRLHTAAPQHPVLGGEGVPQLVRDLVNPRPVAVGGGSSLVNAMGWDAASESFGVTASPSMRMVVDLADLDASTWVTMTGTSGHPGSVHYTDQLGAWAEGRTFPWPFTAEAVREASVRELVLRPGGS